MHIEGLQALIGKQIAGFISVRGSKAGPDDQLILLFDDNTHFEIFGSVLGWSGHTYPGGRDVVMETLRPEGGSVTEIGAADPSGD